MLKRYSLSYTSFELSDLKLSQKTLKGNQALDIMYTITNTGNTEGAEVVQLYLQDLESSVRRPLKELKGFQKRLLKPGQSETIKFTVTKDDLSFWDSHTKKWKAESGRFRVHIGTSSRDIMLTTDFDYQE